MGKATRIITIKSGTDKIEVRFSENTNREIINRAVTDLIYNLTSDKSTIDLNVYEWGVIEEIESEDDLRGTNG